MFFTALIVVLITLTSIVFPALVIRTLGGFPNYYNVNPFETGTWTWQLLVTDLIVFALAFLYFKNKLPMFVAKSIRFIFNFEVPKKIAFISVLVILGIFISFAVEHLSAPEPWEDYPGVKKQTETWTIHSIVQGYGLHVKLFLLSSSLKIFDSDKVVPLLVSISLLVLTYFITSEISKKRFAGIVSLVIVLQSNIFLTYDSSPTYENSWMLLYVLSLYMIIKKWPLSPISYVLSLFSKPLTAVFFPMTFFFIYDSPISRKNKIWVSVSYGVIVAILISAFFFYNGPQLTGGLREFNSHDFWQGFTTFSTEFRQDGLITLFILPLIVGLGIASKKRILYADSIMVLITWVFLLSSVLLAFTNQTNQPYRFMPLVIFFSIGVGTLLSRNFREQV